MWRLNKKQIFLDYFIFLDCVYNTIVEQNYMIINMQLISNHPYCNLNIISKLLTNSLLWILNQASKNITWPNLNQYQVSPTDPLCSRSQQTSLNCPDPIWSFINAFNSSARAAFKVSSFISRLKSSWKGSTKIHFFLILLIISCAIRHFVLTYHHISMESELKF
jgi:hypothetical protein